MLSQGLAWVAVTHSASWGSRSCQRCHGNRLNQSQSPQGAENELPAATESGPLWCCWGCGHGTGQPRELGWRQQPQTLVQGLQHVTGGKDCGMFVLMGEKGRREETLTLDSLPALSGKV